MEGMGGGVVKVEISTPALSPDTLAPFSPQNRQAPREKKRVPMGFLGAEQG